MKGICWLLWICITMFGSYSSLNGQRGVLCAYLGFTGRSFTYDSGFAWLYGYMNLGTSSVKKNVDIIDSSENQGSDSGEILPQVKRSNPRQRRKASNEAEKQAEDASKAASSIPGEGAADIKAGQLTLHKTFTNLSTKNEGMAAQKKTKDWLARRRGKAIVARRRAEEYVGMEIEVDAIIQEINSKMAILAALMLDHKRVRAEFAFQRTFNNDETYLFDVDENDLQFGIEELAYEMKINENLHQVEAAEVADQLAVNDYPSYLYELDEIDLQLAIEELNYQRKAEDDAVNMDIYEGDVSENIRAGISTTRALRAQDGRIVSAGTQKTRPPGSTSFQMKKKRVISNSKLIDSHLRGIGLANAVKFSKGIGILRAKPYGSAPYRNMKKVRPDNEDGWMPIGCKWKTRLEEKGLKMLVKDAGGNGDCLYHSISLGQHYRGEPLSMPEVRRYAADAITGFVTEGPVSRWNPENEAKFLEVFGLYKALEHDSWDDPWLPSDIENNRKVFYDSEGKVLDLTTNEGKASAVRSELMRTGNNHWGTAMDIGALEKALDLGIIVMDDSTGKFYPTGRDNKLRRHYMFIYIIGRNHFQLVSLQTEGGNKVVFRPSEIPQGILDIYKEDTNNDLIQY